VENTSASIAGYLPVYADFVEHRSVDVDDFLEAGVMYRARELNERLGRRVFNDNDQPMFFTGDLNASLVLIQLNQKQPDRPRTGG